MAGLWNRAVLKIAVGLYRLKTLRRPPRPLPQNHDWRSIVIYQATALGDALFATAAIRAVRKSFPKAKLGLICRNRSSDLMALNPHLDELLIYRGKSKSFGPLTKALKEGRYEVGVVLHGNDPETLPILSSGGVEYIVGQDDTVFAFLQSLTLPAPRRSQHVIDHRLDMVRAIGAEPDGRHMEQSLDQDTLGWAESFIAEKLPGDGPLIIIAPGASGPHKIWPAERFGEIAGRLQEEYQARIVILTIPQEAPLAETIQKDLSGPSWASNGRADILQAAGLIAASNLVLANDSGLYNLGQALRVPTIAVGGPEGPCDYGPLPEHQAEMISLRHEACDKPDCLNTGCPDPVCIKAVDVEMVWERVKARLIRD